MPSVLWIVLVLASVVAMPPAGTTATLTVTDCGDTTPGGAPGQLRRLITDAAPGDTIQVPACVITLTGEIGEDANAGGDLDIGKNLTIQGAGARRTVIHGAGFADRILDVLAPAVVAVSDLMVRDGRIANQGFVEGPPRGGGIRNAGNLTLSRVVVRGNAAWLGGGLANDGTLVATESSIESNVASAPVSARAGAADNTGSLTLIRSTVNGNTASGSHTLAITILNSGTLALIDSTISGNGGGFHAGHVVSGPLTVTGSAIVNNVTSGFQEGGTAVVGPATLQNTIIANNVATAQCSGVIISNGGNLATDDSCGLTNFGDAVVADPGLGPLSAHGGPTHTRPLLPGSPAIDTALPGPCGPTDQRGVPRPQDGNGNTIATCDKGPFEFTPPIFVDLPADHVARGAGEALRANGVTGGCGSAPLAFCPDDPAARGQVAVFLLRALEGPGFAPPPASGLFADVPADHPFAAWIEELFNRGITGGCGTAPARFCPADPVTRGQLAVFLLRTMSMAGFVPKGTAGIFADVPASDPFAPWIEEIFRRGITTGCGPAPDYCPAAAITRAQIALFLVRSFGLGF